MTRTAAERAVAVRRGAGLFDLEGRGLLVVEGADRVRWLNGMLTRDVAALEGGGAGHCAYTLLLDPKGRIVADAFLIPRRDALWLDVEPGAAGFLRERLEKYVVADDVRLSDESGAWAHLSVEGREAPAVLARALEPAVAPAAEACADVRLAGVAVTLAGYGWSGAPACQIFVRASEAGAVAAALRAAGGDALVEGDAEVLEILRIEAGVPRLGAELDEEVFPAEAGLVERAVSLDKGCFTGQEVVARIESRGAVNHRLVGFELELAPDRELPEPDTDVFREGARVGELTSVCHSAAAGPIGLGYVRVPGDAPGTPVRIGDVPARVAPLPFVRPDCAKGS